MHIREARSADVLAILDIYNHVVTTSAAMFDDRPATLETQLGWYEGKVVGGWPVLVAVVDSPKSEVGNGSSDEQDLVIGFGTFGQFRTWPGYRFSVEHSVRVS